MACVKWHYKILGRTTKRPIVFVVFTLAFLVVIFWNINSVYFKNGQTTFHRLPALYAKNIYPPTHAKASFHLFPNNYFMRQKKNFVTFFVKSATEHFHHRHTIRHTWGELQVIDHLTIKVVFLVGTSKDDAVNKLIQLESVCFGDILQSDVIDHFHNLTLKTLGAFKWIFDQKKSYSSFYVFTDDDCVVNLHNTMAFLKKKRSNGKSMYCGFMFEKNSGVIRGTGKLSVQPAQYPDRIYPDFCRGVMVIMTHDMLIDIYLASTVTNYQTFPLEDIMVYGILRQKISSNHRNIHPVINLGLPLVFYPWDETEGVVQKMKDKWKKFALELHSRYLVRHKTYNKLKCFGFDMKMPSLMLNLKHDKVFNGIQ